MHLPFMYANPLTQIAAKHHDFVVCIFVIETSRTNNFYLQILGVVGDVSLAESKHQKMPVFQRGYCVSGLVYVKVNALVQDITPPYLKKCCKLNGT